MKGGLDLSQNLIQDNGSMTRKQQGCLHLSRAVLNEMSALGCWSPGGISRALGREACMLGLPQCGLYSLGPGRLEAVVPVAALSSNGNPSLQ